MARYFSLVARQSKRPVSRTASLGRPVPSRFSGKTGSSLGLGVSFTEAPVFGEFDSQLLLTGLSTFPAPWQMGTRIADVARLDNGRHIHQEPQSCVEGCADIVRRRDRQNHAGAP
jgi:hypothetical protein